MWYVSEHTAVNKYRLMSFPWTLCGMYLAENELAMLMAACTLCSLRSLCCFCLSGRSCTRSVSIWENRWWRPERWEQVIYAFLNRLLIPTGFHHALNSVFWFDMAGISDLNQFWRWNRSLWTDGNVYDRIFSGYDFRTSGSGTGHVPYGISGT